MFNKPESVFVSFLGVTVLSSSRLIERITLFEQAHSGNVVNNMVLFNLVTQLVQ
jgi:hypothetical protein